MITEFICKRCNAVVHLKVAATSSSIYCFACKKILGFKRLHKGNELYASSYPFICKSCHHEFTSLKRQQRVCDACEIKNIDESTKKSKQKHEQIIEADPVLLEAERQERREYGRLAMERIRADPVRLENLHKYQRKYCKQRYTKIKANPILLNKWREYNRQKKRERYQKIRSDPILWAQEKQRRKMQYQKRKVQQVCTQEV